LPDAKWFRQVPQTPHKIYVKFDPQITRNNYRFSLTA